MKKLQYILCYLIFSILIFSCQNRERQSPGNVTVVDFSTINGIDLGNLSSLSQVVYNEIKPFDVIMVGEMHGTQEPAKLVGSLAKLIAKNEEEVYVGVEIPDRMINLNNNELNEANILKTDFFSMEESDGRNSEAWLNLLINCGADERIKVFFYDNNIASNRDSSMYLGVKNIKELHPKRKILTLSGNIHNMLVPFEGGVTMGSCIIKDSLAFQPSKIMSINHYYKKGTMINNIGNGMELQEVKGIDLSEFSKHKNFLSKMFKGKEEEYNYFFFTEKVNHSEKKEK